MLSRLVYPLRWLGDRIGATAREERFVDWPSYDTPPPVAFVDVDGTLLAETTTYLFARILRRRGMIKRSFILRALYHGLQHRLGHLDYGRLVAFGLESIARVPIVELERIAESNFQDHVKPRLYEGVVEHFSGLIAGGTKVVLVSSSPGIVIEPLAKFLGCEATITTPVRIETGRIVGIADGPACYGEGKLFWAEKWAGARGIAMEAVASYGDNWSDRTLLGRSGRAIAVHPKGKLRRLAIARGWTICRPRRPERRQSGRFLSRS